MSPAALGPPEARSSRMTMRRTTSSGLQGELTRPSPVSPLHSKARAPSPTRHTLAYPPSRVTTPTLTTMLGLLYKAPTAPLV